MLVRFSNICLEACTAMRNEGEGPSRAGQDLVFSARFHPRVPWGCAVRPPKDPSLNWGRLFQFQHR